MLTTWRRCCLALLLVMLGSAPARPQEEAGDPGRVIETLQLTGGSVVAEIGAGDGALTLAIARHVGADGHVFTTELGRERVAALREAVRTSGLSNVDVLDAHRARTNLPQACCDAIVMRDVYHHLDDPAAMNASLLASLRPGGLIAVLDFEPRTGSESASPAGRSSDGRHGVGRATVVEELTAAGFTSAVATSIAARRFIVVAQKPQT